MAKPTSPPIPQPFTVTAEGVVVIGPDGQRAEILPDIGGYCPRCGTWSSRHRCRPLHEPVGASMQADLERIVAYLGGQWLPPAIKTVFDRFKARLMQPPALTRYDVVETGLGTALGPSPQGRYYLASDVEPWL